MMLAMDEDAASGLRCVAEGDVTLASGIRTGYDLHRTFMYTASQVCLHFFQHAEPAEGLAPS